MALVKEKKKNIDKNIEKRGKDGRRINPKSVANLIPAKKGEVRNPEGRPAGKRNFDTLVDLAIEALAMEYVRQTNAKQKNTKKHITLEDVDIEGDIFKQFINKARNGDLKAIDSFLDRRHGKATQPVEIGGLNGEPIRHRIELEEAEKEIDDWQKQWGNKKANDNSTSDKGSNKKGANK